MKNDDIKNFLEWEAPHKFDICLTNPPYGSTGGDTIHLKFVKNSLSCCDNVVAVFPFTFVTKTSNKPAQKYKGEFSNSLLSVEEISANEFIETDMPNVGIYVFNTDKMDDTIKIEELDSNTKHVKTLNDVCVFDDYEENIVRHLSNCGAQNIIGDCGRLNSWKKYCLAHNDKTEQENIKYLVSKSLKKCDALYEDKGDYFGLTVNKANGRMNGTAFTNMNGDILQYSDFAEYFENRKLGSGYNILVFDTRTQAENCKKALKRALLRFTLYRLQDDQIMTIRVYRYIPNIDWEDDRCLTDEGLLEMCGCPKEKAKEYANYCKNVMDKVDNL